MVKLGVGANMVSSMKFWSKALGLVSKDYIPTAFGRQLFGTYETGFADALDRYCESMSTLWLFHWNLAKNSTVLTVLWYLFNKFNYMEFTKELLAEHIQYFLKEQVALGRLKAVPSAKTLERDIEVVLRAYCPKTRDVGLLRKSVAALDNAEDVADDPLRELGLLSVNFNTYSFVRSAHSSLSNAVFAWCLLDYRTSLDGLITLDFNRLAYDEGCVGRVFKLDENTLGEHLQQLSDTTEGFLSWSEQNGLRQVVCRDGSREASAQLQLKMLKKAYEEHE